MRFEHLSIGRLASGRFRLLAAESRSEWVGAVIEPRRLSAEMISFYPPGADEQTLPVDAAADSPEARTLLDELTLRNTAMLAGVMRIGEGWVDIRGRLFTLPPVGVPEAVQVALTDEFIETQVAYTWRMRGREFRQAVDELRREFLLNDRYWFLSAGPRDPSFAAGFSLVGRSRVMDLKNMGNGELHAIRIAPRHQRKSDANPIYLMQNSLAFVDQTLAGTMQQPAVAVLEQAVKESGSWISAWEAYNHEEERLLQEKYEHLPPLAYGRPPRQCFDQGGNLTLEFDLDPGSSVGPWIKHLAGDGLPIAVSPSGEKPLPGKEGATGGNAIDFDDRTRRLTVTWDDDGAVPPRGVIRPWTRLPRQRLEKRNQALGAVRAATAKLPLLGPLLEGKPMPPVERRRVPVFTPAVFAKFGGYPTPIQENALRTALAVPDIALILGPPGTGKTRVIQALLTALTRKSKDDEPPDTVLVTSFQHEAVDNVTEGMSVTGLPVDRRGGRGKEDRGAQFAEAWARQRIAKVGAMLPKEPGPTRVLIDELRGLVSQWRENQRNLLFARDILFRFRQRAAVLLPPQRSRELQDLLDRMGAESPTATVAWTPLVNDPDERADLEELLARQRMDREGFLEEGPSLARKLKRRLRPYADELPPDLPAQLEALGSWEEGNEPDEPWTLLPQIVETIRRQLLTVPQVEEMVPSTDLDAVEETMVGALCDLEEARRTTADGVTEALELYIRFLQEQPRAVRDTLGAYSAIQAASCGQADSKRLGLQHTSYQVVVVDEAARANPLDLLIPLVKGYRIILVGDHHQLPHVLERDIEQALAKKGGEQVREVYQKSLFERLWKTLRVQTEVDGIQRVVKLTDQFRMHPVIGNFVSRWFYDGEISSDRVDPQKRANDTGLYGGKPVAWIDVPATAGAEERNGTSWRRRAEAIRIMAELRRLLPVLEERYPNFDPSRPEGMVGVITFYAGQEDLLEWYLDDPGHGLPGHLRRRVKIGTVDAFQGREYDIVFLSTVRSNRNESLGERLGFTALPNRLCVAFSRARCLLVGVGDGECVAGLRPDGDAWSEPLYEFMKLCRSEGVYER